MTAGCVVVKLGGSLLDLPDLVLRMEQFFEARRKERLLLLVGGGAIVDLVRQWDVQHRLGDEAAHWLAIRCLELTSRLVSGLLPVLTLVTELKACEDLWSQGALPLFDPLTFLIQDDRRLDALPPTWDVTSDSIAARVAEVAGAQELVLLKSTDVRQGLSRSEASRLGYVDPCFPQASRRLSRVFVQNLRDAASKPVELLPG